MPRDLTQTRESHSCKSRNRGAIGRSLSAKADRDDMLKARRSFDPVTNQPYGLIGGGRMSSVGPVSMPRRNLLFRTP